MPKITIIWHVNATYSETFDCPDEQYNQDDFDELDWAFQELFQYTDDDFLPTSYDRDIDGIAIDIPEEYAKRLWGT